MTLLLSSSGNKRWGCQLGNRSFEYEEGVLADKCFGASCSLAARCLASESCWKNILKGIRKMLTEVFPSLSLFPTPESIIRSWWICVSGINNARESSSSLTPSVSRILHVYRILLLSICCCWFISTAEGRRDEIHDPCSFSSSPFSSPSPS